MIYFDSAATTKPAMAVLKTYEQVNEKFWCNTSSMHKGGIAASSLLERAQTTIREALQTPHHQVLFTGSATEANNIAIYGICRRYMGQNKHIITTKIEHPSVLRCFEDLEKNGFTVTYLPVDDQGSIAVADLKQAIRPETVLVSVMWVNNIMGTIQPLAQICALLQQYPKIKFHVDAVQGIGKLQPTFAWKDIDLFTFTAHKLQGLKGTGCLLYKENIVLLPPLQGGHQQGGIRPGTVDLAGCVCLAKALQQALSLAATHFQTVTLLYQTLYNELCKLSFLSIHRSEQAYSPYVLNLSFHHIKGETAMHYLESHDIYVGTGSACNATSKQLDRTILEVTKHEQSAINSIRISLSSDNTLEEIAELVKRIKELGKM